MALEKKDIEKLASLSRLRFSDEKLETFGAEFNNVLKFVAQIAEVNTDGVPPLTTTMEGASTPERADVVAFVGEAQRAELQKGAPSTEMGFYVVPRIVE